MVIRYVNYFTRKDIGFEKIYLEIEKIKEQFYCCSSSDSHSEVFDDLTKVIMWLF